MATYASPLTSRRLFIHDKKNNLRFLVDTGSDCSLIPANKTDKMNTPVQTFVAANGTLINVYKRELLSLDLGLRKQFVYPFYVCNVSTPIIGADFLHYFNLKPNLRKGSLFDNVTNINSHCVVHSCNIYSIICVVNNDIFSKILNQYPNIIKSPLPKPKSKTFGLASY